MHRRHQEQLRLRREPCFIHARLTRRPPLRWRLLRQQTCTLYAQAATSFRSNAQYTAAGEIAKTALLVCGVDIVHHAVTSPHSDAYVASSARIAAIASLVSGAVAAHCAWSVAPFTMRRSADDDVQELKSSGPITNGTNGSLSPTTMSLKQSTAPMSKMQTPGEHRTKLRLTEDGTNLW